MTGAKDEEVLNEIFRLWITILGNFLAKSIKHDGRYKKQSKKITSKSKVLRTKLFTDQVAIMHF